MARKDGKKAIEVMGPGSPEYSKAIWALKEREIYDGARYELDGEECPMDSFLAANELDASEVESITALAVGESRIFGGGAAAAFELKRVR